MFVVFNVLVKMCFPMAAAIRVHEFFKTSYFKTGIHPIPGSQQALHKLSRFCSLSVVTYEAKLLFFLADLYNMHPLTVSFGELLI